MAYQGTSPNIGTHRKLDAISFDGASSTYSVTSNGSAVALVSSESCIVSLNGVLQNPGIGYTVSGSTITFYTPPAVGVSFFGLVLGERVLIADVLPLSGGTMTGGLTLNGNPSTVLGAATKQYVDSGVASANTTASTAQSTANIAVSSASTAQATANSAVSAASTAQSTANSAVSAAAAAQSTANSAVSSASTAQSTANSAVSAASTAQATANAKQDPIQSGVHVKTVNSKTIVGSGDMIPTPYVVVTGSGYTAASGQCAVLVGSSYLTLPANPTSGDWVQVINQSGTTTCVLGRNGQNIIGLAEDMIINAINVGFTAVFTDSARGWCII
jgi:hypothetical protein